jgi:hypothetical protein
MSETATPNSSLLEPRLVLQLSEMERAVLEKLAAFELKRLQILDKEASYDELGFRHGARAVLSDLQYRLQSIREYAPEGAGEAR